MALVGILIASVALHQLPEPLSFGMGVLLFLVVTEHSTAAILDSRSARQRATMQH